MFKIQLYSPGCTHKIIHEIVRITKNHFILTCLLIKTSRKTKNFKFVLPRVEIRKKVYTFKEFDHDFHDKTISSIN